MVGKAGGGSLAKRVPVGGERYKESVGKGLQVVADKCIIRDRERGITVNQATCC